MYLSIRNTINLALSWLGESGWGIWSPRSRDVPEIWNPTGIISKSHKNSRQTQDKSGKQVGEKDTLNAYLLAPQTYTFFFFWFWPFWHPKRVTRVTRHYRQKVPFLRVYLVARVYIHIVECRPPPGDSRGTILMIRDIFMGTKVWKWFWVVWRILNKFGLGIPLKMLAIFARGQNGVNGGQNAPINTKAYQINSFHCTKSSLSYISDLSLSRCDPKSGKVNAL